MSTLLKSFAIFLVSAQACFAVPDCQKYLVPPHSVMRTAPVIEGMKVASISDPTRSTGATLFYFPEGANIAYDSRGGSVASSETTLFDEGSYSNNINAIVFAGGSTMGLAAGDGVRHVIFRKLIESGQAGQFDFIPSVPSAVVYDFGGRVHRGSDKYVYPNHELGRALADNLSDEFQIGRFGAGTTTSVNKIGQHRWGGQGAASAEFPWGKIFVAVVLNSSGDIFDGNTSFTEQFPPIGAKKPGASRAGENTTLSIIVTDVPLDRNQLKRLAVTVHTSMGRTIFPFQTSVDGDIQFAASVPRAGGNGQEEQLIADASELEFELAMRGAELMRAAMLEAVRSSNQARQSKR